MSCSACLCHFNDREEQVEHYKLDWHRFNLKRRVTGCQPVSADEFERKSSTGDISSISGSESEDSFSDSDSSQLTGGNFVEPLNNEIEKTLQESRFPSKIFFQNCKGLYLSVVSEALLNRKDPKPNICELLSSLRALNTKTSWVILITGGGHFAGAVFSGSTVVEHKTFHRYTVRAKRGMAQSVRDSQNHSHAPRSAGASLRRYNEAALKKDIQELLESWSDYLKNAIAIYLRAPSYNKATFFSGKNPPLKKDSPNLHYIPFATRRATFSEVKRVHELLSTVHIYGKDTVLEDILNPQKKGKSVKRT
ncbi:ankyrin repeat and zinc finger domain-containing protein 1 isoform X2 [Protopterus annectens]|nr:ankyrin repeat and zinc finger domain-containing protein 1 isoform X2 [Protopterus annectens]